jgi:hypothetical protein
MNTCIEQLFELEEKRREGALSYALVFRPHACQSYTLRLPSKLRRELQSVGLARMGAEGGPVNSSRERWAMKERRLWCIPALVCDLW